MKLTHPMLTMSRIKYGNEENIPVLEKNTGKCNSVRSLPPNVSGQSSGLLVSLSINCPLDHTDYFSSLRICPSIRSNGM